MRAADHALLVGVTGYAAEVAARAPVLRGPRNDVALLYRTLRAEWGPEARLHVLADGLEPGPAAAQAALPTRAAILAALAELARAAAPGDRVLIYLSGHGTQFPAAPGSIEDDGFDEAFLPLDTSFRDGMLGQAILDDEIGVALDRILATGADVWLIADSCYSGTLERSAPGGLTPRMMPPASGNSAGGNAVRPDLDPPATIGASGRFTGFYAAGPGQLAYELEVLSDTEAPRVHGLLTWTLVEALRDRPAARYADLARAIAARYWQLGSGVAAPMFAGALDLPPMLRAGGPEVFGLTAGDDGLALAAGRLDGIGPGTELAIGMRGETPLLKATVADATLDRATLRLAPGEALARAMAAEGIPPRYSDRWLADRAPQLEARVIARPLRLTLRVAAEDADAARLLSTIAARPAEDLGLRLDPVPAGHAADLRLVGAQGRMWLLPDGAPLIASGPGRSESLPPDDADALAEALVRRGRARNLLAIAADTAAAIDTGTALGLTAALALAPAPGCGAPGPEPAQLPATAHPALTFDAPALAPIAVADCSQVHLSLRNTGSLPLDASPFYVGPEGRIYYLDGYRDGAYFGLRIDPGATRIVSFTESGAGGPVGLVQLAVLAVEADPAAPYARDFRHLAAPPGSTAPDRAGPVSPLDAQLAAAGFGAPAARRACAPPVTGGATALILPLRTGGAR